MRMLLFTVCCCLLLAACGTRGTTMGQAQSTEPTEQSSESLDVTKTAPTAAPGGSTPAVAATPAAGSDAPADISPLAGTSWKLAQLGDEELDASRLPTLQFEAAGLRASGFAGVNRYSTSYRADASGLAFQAAVSTRMASTPERMRVEQLFLAAIEKTAGYRLEDAKLLLLDASGATLAVMTS